MKSDIFYERGEKMKISIGPDSLSLYKTASISATKKNSLEKQSFNQKDTLTIGQQAQNLFNGQQYKTSLIESLMKQRESIQEMKNNLTERTLNNGGDIAAIKEQLKEFDKHLADIDAQIAEQQIDSQKKPNVDSVADKNNSADVNEDILSKTVSLEQAERLHLAKNALTREDNRLESEVNLDANRGIFIDRKYDKLSDLEVRIQNIQERITEKLEDNKNKSLDDKLIVDISDKKQEETEEEFEVIF